MDELRELYQQMIIDHGRHPHNFKADPQADYIKEGYNPLCGDKLTLYLNTTHDHITEATFQGSGCAISIASASLLTEAVKGRTIQDVEKLFQDFHQLVTQGWDEMIADRLGKLAVLRGVVEFPTRVKCATLAWHTAIAALRGQKEMVTTE